VNERVIVIEQRLRSGGVASAVGGITFLFILVSTIFFETSSSALPAVAVAIDVVVFAALVFVVLIFLRVIVRVVQMGDGRALEVVYGPGGFVRQVFEPQEVEAAYARHLSFAEMGGWGYRGSLRLLRQAALVTRRGDALEVQLTHKRRFIVTVDEPADFVSALTPSV
jgi:hypothetical protein